MINCVLEPMLDIQMNVGAHLLAEFLKKFIAQEDEKVLPQFCICIDTSSMKLVGAPEGYEMGKVRTAISDASKDFGERWNTI